MTAEGTDLHDDLISLLKHLDLALSGEGKKDANLIAAVPLFEGVGFFGPAYGRRNCLS